MPNLINPESIPPYLEGFLPENQEAADLLKLALTKPLATRSENLQEIRAIPKDAPPWLKVKWPEGGPYHRFEPDSQLHDQVRHIADWIEVALQDKDHSLNRRDDSGKPFAFVGIRKLEDATQLADQEMRLRNLKLAKSLAPVGEGEVTVKQFDDGYRIVKLISPSALDREGVAMGSCIGQGAYDGKLARHECEYYSLRDQRNEPHATIEVKTARHAVIQCQGKENKAPVAKYLPYLQAYLQEGRYNLEAPANRTGLVQVGEQYHSIYNLPRDLKIEGDLDLSGTNIARLPEVLVVNGHLDLKGTPLSRLPDVLKIGRGLDLKDSKISRLPEVLEVGWGLDLSNTKITSLPAGLKVGGDLHLSNTKITSLPEGLEAGGGLYVPGTQITQLPEGLKVNGDLDLSNTPITQLPDRLEVGGYLDLRNTPITSLPAGLKVGGGLNLSGTRITSLPKGLKVEGSLDLRCTDVSQLPEGLTVSGNVHIYLTQIDSLPERMKVGGGLFLGGRSSLIRKLPEALEVGGDLDLHETGITKIPNGLKVGGSLDLSDSAIEQLPQGLKIAGSLFLGGTPIKQLPTGLTVDQSLVLSGTAIDRLPNGLKVGKDLDLTGTKVTDIPDDAEIGGEIIGLTNSHTARVKRSRSGHFVADHFRN